MKIWSASLIILLSANACQAGHSKPINKGAKTNVIVKIILN
jgi:hypothetical protein